MRSNSWLRFLFVIYCLEAGLFLVIAPWTDAWERIILLLPLAPLRLFFATTWVRGLISGFGLVHLVWAAHDVDLILRPPPELAPRSVRSDSGSAAETSQAVGSRSPVHSSPEPELISAIDSVTDAGMVSGTDSGTDSRVESRTVSDADSRTDSRFDSRTDSRTDSRVDSKTLGRH